MGEMLQIEQLIDFLCKYVLKIQSCGHADIYQI